MLTANPDFPPFSKQEYDRRYEEIRHAMTEKGLDCLVIYGSENCYGNDRGAPHLVYLANYVSIPMSYVVFPLQGEPTLVIRTPLHLDNARDISPVKDVRTGSWFNIAAGVGERLAELGLEHGRIGLVGTGLILPTYTIPFEHHEYLTDSFPEAQFENVTGWFGDLRNIKSQEERTVLKKAGVVVSHGYEHMILMTRPGIRHCDVTAAVQILGTQLGASYPLMHFSSTPMANPSQNYPDPIATARTVEADHAVMTELVMGYGSYTAKIMGTYFTGEPNQLYRDLYETAALVYTETVKKLKPGMTGRDTDQFLEPIKQAGFVTQGNLIMGWGNYMERPRVGALQGTHGTKIQSPEDMDYIFKSGQSLYVVARTATPDLKAGVWVGASCLMTEDGLEEVVTHPMTKIRVV